MEQCPKCDRARLYGWRSAMQMQHCDACRARIELALEQTQRGRERLEHAKLRFDRRRAALAAHTDDAQLGPAGVEGEMSGAGGPPTNFPPQAEEDDEMQDGDDDSDSDKQYSPASPGEPMSVQQLTAATEPPGTEVAACPRGPSSRGAPGDPGCK